jgi:hypothetical protein
MLLFSATVRTLQYVVEKNDDVQNAKVDGKLLMNLKGLTLSNLFAKKTIGIDSKISSFTHQCVVDLWGPIFYY